MVNILSRNRRRANDHSAAQVRFHLQRPLHVGSLHLILSAVLNHLNIAGVPSAWPRRLSLVWMALVLPVFMQLAAEQAQPAVPVIFDTDMESDVDDVGALAMLHALADQGEAVILAVMVSAKNPHSAACADRINTYFNRPALPIGNVKGPGVDRASRYARQVAVEFPGSLSSDRDASDATELYREILAAQPERSVVLLSVGYKTNLRNLLHSKPCRHSNLGGKELVKRKVRLWICMGGQFPEGREANIRWDAAAAAEAIGNWPTEIIFSGWEIGRPIMTGGRLEQLPRTSPVRRSYELFNGLKPHHSWDQAATLFAVRGLDNGSASEYWTLSPPGRIVIDPADGSNTWEEKPGGTHRYKLTGRDPARIADEIDVLMMHLP
jgi:purine nucleosidase